MQKVILYIQPQLRTTTTAQDYVRVDLMEEDLIELTQVIQDVKDIDKVFTDYSKTFNLPASKTNNKIFKWWYNPDVEGFDNQLMANARIELNHFHFKFGKIKLEEVVMRNGEASMYKITFFGDTVKISDIINEDQLSDLDWLNNFNHNNTSANVLAGLNAGLDFTVDSVSYTDAIIYPLITHSQRYIYDSSGLADVIVSGVATSSASSKLVDTSENFTNVVQVNDIVKNITNTTYALVTAIDDNNHLTISSNIMSTGESYQISRTNVGNVSWGGTSGGNLNYNRHGVLPEDLKPAILVKHIVKAIEEQYDEIEFKTSEFFDSAPMNNLYMWLHRDIKKMALAGTWVGNSDAYTCSGSNCSDFTNSSSTTYFNTGNGIMRFQPTTNVNLISEQLTMQLTITPAGGYTNVPYDMEIVRSNNWETYVSSQNQTGTQSITMIIGPNGPIDINTLPKVRNYFVGRVTTEESFQFEAKYSLTYTNTIFNGTTTNTNTFIATMTSNSSTLTPQDGLLEITENIPKMKVLDFLKGLFKMFNLTAYVNFDGKIVVQTLDDYYAGGDTHNITEYIKTDEHTVSNSIPFKAIDFEYVDSKTFLATQFKNLNNRKYGELNYKSNINSGNDYKIESPFEHILYERLSNQSGLQNVKRIQYGAYVDEKFEPIVENPLLFYGVYNQYTLGAQINFIDSTRPEDNSLPIAGTQTAVSDYWMPHNAPTIGNTSTAPAYNLNFGSEINSYDLTDFGGNNNSLFQLYYQDYITRVFNKKIRIYNFSAILPLGIILKLSLDDKIIINDRTYTINKMSIKLQSGEASFELLNEAPE